MNNKVILSFIIAVGMFGSALTAYNVAKIMRVVSAAATEYDTAARAVPGIEILDVRDEPLLSKQGNPIGVLLTFRVRVPEDIVSVGLVFPALGMPPEKIADDAQNLFRIRGGVRITPPPERSERDSQRFVAGQEYMFSAEMIPGFVFPNVRGTRYCMRTLVDTGGTDIPSLERELARRNETYRYRIRMEAKAEIGPGTTFDKGFTEHEYSMGMFYESLLKEGAKECPRTTVEAYEEFERFLYSE